MSADSNGQTIKEIDGGNIASPRGFVAAGLHCGIKKRKKDLGIILSKTPAVCAAVYTTNTFSAAPLQVTKESLSKSATQQVLIVNSGNANAFTGEQGLQDAIKMRKSIAEHYSLSPLEAIVSSTGVIGEKMPMEVILTGISRFPKELAAAESGGLDFCEAIMTTDTVIKALAIELEIDQKKVVIGGAAKGSGMIHPNMATMLAYITTDVNICKNALERALRQVTDQTFNMITVDGDTSTNDQVLVMANGLAGNAKLDEKHPQWSIFYHGLSYVAEQLAKLIARDGEGATKLITVNVAGAKTSEMARTIAKKIIGSNLVKTAVFGADGNWGRIVMAIGNSGFAVAEQQLEIAIGGITVVKGGQSTNYLEEQVTEALQNKDVLIDVDFHQGEESATAWGCDLSYDYVKINASYRT